MVNTVGLPTLMSVRYATNAEGERSRRDRGRGLSDKCFGSGAYRGTSPIRNAPPPQDQHRTLGIVLIKGIRRGVVHMNEVPL